MTLTVFFAPPEFMRIESIYSSIVLSAEFGLPFGLPPNRVAST
jgi:hypothetical protein